MGPILGVIKLMQIYGYYAGNIMTSVHFLSLTFSSGSSLVVKGIGIGWRPAAAIIKQPPNLQRAPHRTDTVS